MHRTKIYENDRVARNESKVLVGNQGIVCASLNGNSVFARFNLWSKKVNKRRIKSPMLRKDNPVIAGLFFSDVIKLMASHIKKTNPNAPIAISQPRRIIRVKKLNRPKRNVRLPGNRICNNRYTAIAVIQKTGLINRVKSRSPRGV